nr:hypothetical protein [uncultured Pseudomonas sp.]
MASLTAAQLLELWDHGSRRHPLDRSLLLLTLAAPERSADTLVELPLGACNAALMRLRCATFGNRLPVWMDCPHCGERLEFELDPQQLPPMYPPPAHIEVDGYRFRCPANRDLFEVAGSADVDHAARRLLLGCADAGTALPDDEQALQELLATVETALEAADPWADLSLDFDCPACERSASASFDVSHYLWEEIDGQARQLLDEVHLLAQAYGWSEPEILALSASRRSAYLARVSP